MVADDNILVWTCLVFRQEDQAHRELYSVFRVMEDLDVRTYTLEEYRFSGCDRGAS